MVSTVSVANFIRPPACRYAHTVYTLHGVKPIEGQQKACLTLLTMDSVASWYAAPSLTLQTNWRKKRQKRNEFNSSFGFTPQATTDITTRLSRLDHNLHINSSFDPHFKLLPPTSCRSRQLDSRAGSSAAVTASMLDLNTASSTL